VGTVVEMLVLDCLFREYWTLLGGCLFVYLGTSQTTVGVMLSYQLCYGYWFNYFLITNPWAPWFPD
jgi:hypothetical protein